jgi:ribonuclease E
MPVAKTEQVTSEAVDIEVAEVISDAPEIVAPVATGEREHPKRSRRGPNRRRPRNPNYKRPDTNGDANGAHEASGDSSDESRPAPPRSYDNDFAHRAEKTERPEPQVQAPSQVSTAPQQTEAPKPAAPAEPAPAPKPVEAVRQETE